MTATQAKKREELPDAIRSMIEPLSLRNGAAGGTRTPDPLITNEVRYQLCHCGDTGATYSSLFRFPTPFFHFLGRICGAGPLH